MIESFGLREGTGYGLQETSLEAKVAQVLLQLRRGDAHITFDPATESVNLVAMSAIGGPGTEGVTAAWYLLRKPQIRRFVHDETHGPRQKL